MNAFVNGCNGNTAPCPFITWWMQGIVEVTKYYNGVSGAFVGKAFVEIWTNGLLEVTDICPVIPSSPPNINQSGMATVEQITLASINSIYFWVVVVNTNNNQVVFGRSLWCLFPGWVKPVYYFDQLEGVVVGDCCGNHASFKPLSSVIFYGYIDLVSHYNDMSSAVLQTQTGESSNLYQNVLSYYDAGSWTCGDGSSGCYLYTVQSTEDTTTVYP